MVKPDIEDWGDPFIVDQIDYSVEFSSNKDKVLKDNNNGTILSGYNSISH